MTQAKQLLENKLREIMRSGGWRDSIAVEQTADPLDTTQGAVEREMATRNLERNAVLIRDIRAAIDRIADGGYGFCLECDEPISSKRLAAVPWAPLCIRCQERADPASNYRGRQLDDEFSSAA